MGAGIEDRACIHSTIKKENYKYINNKHLSKLDGHLSRLGYTVVVQKRKFIPIWENKVQIIHDLVFRYMHANCCKQSYWLLHENDFNQSHHRNIFDWQGGDADSNACVAGAMLGCKLGLEAIPQSWREGLLHREWLDQKIAR